jgi:hypothetical protein
VAGVSFVVLLRGEDVIGRHHLALGVFGHVMRSTRDVVHEEPGGPGQCTMAQRFKSIDKEAKPSTHDLAWASICTAGSLCRRKGVCERGQEFE